MPSGLGVRGARAQANRRRPGGRWPESPTGCHTACPLGAAPLALPGDLEIAATGTINFRVLVDKAGLRLFSVGIAEVDIGKILTDLGVGSSGLDLSGALVLSNAQVLWVPTVGGAQSESCRPRQGPNRPGARAAAAREAGRGTSSQGAGRPAAVAFVGALREPLTLWG
jgi:hypothetical protein